MAADAGTATPPSGGPEGRRSCCAAATGCTGGIGAGGSHCTGEAGGRSGGGSAAASVFIGSAGSAVEVTGGAVATEAPGAVRVVAGAGPAGVEAVPGVSGAAKYQMAASAVARARKPTASARPRRTLRPMTTGAPGPAAPEGVDVEYAAADGTPRRLAGPTGDARAPGAIRAADDRAAGAVGTAGR